MGPDTVTTSPPSAEPPVFNYILSFLLVGVAWGFTTPFIRRAAADFQARQEKQQQAGAQKTELQTTRAQSTSTNDRDGGSTSNQGDEDKPLQSSPPTSTPHPASKDKSSSWLSTKFISVFWTVVNLLRTPAYAVPLVVNLTGSVWFFLLVGKHGMLT